MTTMDFLYFNQDRHDEQNYPIDAFMHRSSAMHSESSRSRKSSLAWLNYLSSRQGQHIVGVEDYKDLCWKDVDRNILHMDRTYDASFGKWVKDESNITITANHMRRLTSEMEAAKVVNGLRWLISDWTLGSITRFVKLMFTQDFWQVDKDAAHSSPMKLASPVPVHGSQLASSCSFHAEAAASATLRSTTDEPRRDSQSHIPGHYPQPSSHHPRRRSSTLMQGPHHPLCSRKRNSFSEPQEDASSSTSTPSASKPRSSLEQATPTTNLTKQPFWLDGDFYALGEIEMQRRITIIRGMTDGWAVHYIADLVASILHAHMPKPSQRHYFVEQLAAGWSFHQLSEFLLYLGPHLPWASKMVMLKAFSSAALPPRPHPCHMMTQGIGSMHIDNTAPVQGNGGFYQNSDASRASLNLHEQHQASVRASDDLHMLSRTHATMPGPSDSEETDYLGPLPTVTHCSCGAPLRVPDTPSSSTSSRADHMAVVEKRRSSAHRTMQHTT